MIKNLYTAALLWLVRPALERYEEQMHPHRRKKSQEAVFDGIVGAGSKGGMIDAALQSVYGLKRN